VDFPYNARYNLNKMVERGFLIRTFKGIDAEELKRLRDEDLKNKEIAEKLGISLITLQRWIKKLNLDRRGTRYPRISWMKLYDNLYRMLKKNGPMPKREVIENLGLNSEKIETLLRIFPEEFKNLNFNVSRRKYSKAFHNLYKASPILYLKGDPRIIDFIASKIDMKIQTMYEAKSVVDLLKWHIGYQKARAVVERLGYRYKENR